MTIKQKVNEKLQIIYTDPADFISAQTIFLKILSHYSKSNFKPANRLSQENVYLITYGDSFISEGKAPLAVLNEVYEESLKETVTDIHLLPMFPFTSDDGFSVTDYLAINPELGSWEDIELLAKDKRLMFDFVANHMSKSSDWFKKFLNRDAGFEKTFVEYDASFDAKNVTRPRTSPLFHEYKNEKGEIISAWTTFSEDQVDVNAKDPETLGKLTEVLLEYALKGATSIRLDAIGFLWKESETTSMHLPQTHEIIQLWRMLIDELVPNVQIITETNVPHEDNISYFGNGSNEANQVYQFPLPPLVLHSFLTGDASKLTKWARNIDRVSDTGTYFNFLASHDGIGLRPTEGILTDNEREALVNRVIENGGKISYKNNPDGTQSVYEMNINYSEALKDINNPEATTQKMIAAHHILLSMVGVPAIYYHSIFGSKNDVSGAEESGINRRINREKLSKETLLTELKNDKYRQEIYSGITGLIEVRKQEKAFNPYSEQELVDCPKGVFALRRKNGRSIVESYTNVSDEPVEIKEVSGIDLLTGKMIQHYLQLAPYEFAWIKKG